MARALLCCGCDAIRDQERAFCGNCNEATDSYTPEDFGDELLFVNGSGSYLGAVRSVACMGFTEAVPHPVYGFAIVDRAA